METIAIEDVKKERYSMGLTILLLLGVFTIGEFGIAAFDIHIWIQDK